jgi:hypothetical protein
MSRVKVIKETNTSVTIMPKYGLAMKLASKRGWYSWGKWVAILLIIAAAVVIYLHATDRVDLGWGASFNFVLGGLILGAMLLIFLKPSQVMVNNEIVVTKKEWDTAVSKGTEEELFTRDWY